ncbi:MAG: M23 family peptidase, partial [Fibrobacter sp.]|nr:M23 family peptidase [Fibrobacter sp.]
MIRFIFLSIAIAISLMGCNEESKIQALKNEGDALRARIDSLSIEIEKAKHLPEKWTIKSDTVQRGDGLFQVLKHMEINEKERGKIVLGMQDSADLVTLRVGQVFYVALDSANSVQRFRFAQNPAVIHVMSKMDTGYVYSRIEKPVTRTISIYEGA